MPLSSWKGIATGNCILVARLTQFGHSLSARQEKQSQRQRLQLSGILCTTRFGSLERRFEKTDKQSTRLVAGRLGHLRWLDDPHGLALGRHLQKFRRKRRRRQRKPTFRPTQQLARQCQFGQGSPTALAHQKEIWQANLLGRPHYSGRKHGLRIYGFQDVRLRRWTRRHLDARKRRQLG